MAPQKELIQNVWLAHSPEHNEYIDRQICDETWCLAIKRCYPSLVDAVSFDHGQLKCALNSIVSLFNESNNRGKYEATFNMECPYIGKKRYVTSITTG